MPTEYDAVDWDEQEKLHNEQGERVIGRSRVREFVAEGGPFDGVKLGVPPGGSEIILPAAFGAGDMRGKVIYRREGDRLVYAGQGDYAEQDPDELI